jgi:hypothetical protein
MKKIHVFIGVIGSGKDYNAAILTNELGCEKFGFSDGVREFTWKFLGWEPKTDEEYEEFKYLEQIFNLPDGKWHVITGRELLENVATWMREIDPEYWGKYWRKTASSHFSNSDHLVVKDCRFIEEIEKIVSLCEEEGWEYSFTFTDFKSDRYEIRNHKSEELAQSFIKRGFTDGEDLTHVCYQLAKTFS